MDHIAEIKSRIPIEELVGRYVQLKKIGRNFRGLCPFHKERTPSFHVSPERQLAYCFGCRKGGDHFTFLQEMEGLDFKGALAQLAEKAGVDLPKTMNFDKKQAGVRDRLIDIHEDAAKFFKAQLHESPEGKKALSYLKKRGLKEEIISSAGLGFAPYGQSGRELYSHLLEKGFSRDEIIASGLAIARDTGSGECIDRFRTRLMIPILNVTGSVCAFGGRAMKDGDEPKYLNSPETPIYHKSSVLYGLSESKTALRSEKTAVIVEGYMDCIAMRQAGINNAVASCGTALTQEQIRLLKRFTSDFILAFDRDEAGQKATLRSIELALQEECSVRIAVWEDAKDPDECLQKNPKKFMEALQSAPHAPEYLLSAFKGAKKNIIAELLPFFVYIKNAVELDDWIKKCSRQLDISQEALYEEWKRFKIRREKFPGQAARRQIQEQQGDMQIFDKSLQPQEYLIGLLLTYYETISIANQIIKPEDFEDNELQNIYISLTTQYNQNLGAASRKPINPINKEREDILALYAQSRHPELNWDALEQEVRLAARAVIKQRFERAKRGIVTSLRQAQGTEREKLLTEYQAMLNEEENLISKTF